LEEHKPVNLAAMSDPLAAACRVTEFIAHRNGTSSSYSHAFKREKKPLDFV
jgi:hypothetical protein